MIGPDPSDSFRTMKPVIPLLAATLALAACSKSPDVSTASLQRSERANVTVPDAVYASMSEKRMDRYAPILVRLYKRESELEVWKRGVDGRYALLKTFPICRWSGQLGPKRRKGDRQAPEGFYSVSAGQMNPNSAYFLSFDLGYPNAVDRANGGTGSALMVHGACTSAGCFAMTDKGVGEIYALARDAFRGGQKSFQVHALPFRMTAENMARYRLDDNYGFWSNLKAGSDRFEATGSELDVRADGRRYAFGKGDAATEGAVQEFRARQAARFAAASRDLRPIRTQYSDGGMHPSFAGQPGNQRGFAVISRPDALAYAGRDVEIGLDGLGRASAFTLLR